MVGEEGDGMMSSLLDPGGDEINGSVAKARY